MYVYQLHACMCNMYIIIDAFRIQRKASGSLKLALQAVVTSPTWRLEPNSDPLQEQQALNQQASVQPVDSKLVSYGVDDTTPSCGWISDNVMTSRKRL